MLIPEISNVINALNDMPKMYNTILLRYLKLVSTQRTLLTYNKFQLSEGMKSDGTQIKPFYASLKYKGRRSPVDLHLTGDFYRSFKIEVFESTDVFLFIFASDKKANFLKGDYGEEIFGLTDENIDRFADDFKEYFLNEIGKEMINRI